MTPNLSPRILNIYAATNAVYDDIAEFFIVNCKCHPCEDNAFLLADLKNITAKTLNSWIDVQETWRCFDIPFFPVFINALKDADGGNLVVLNDTYANIGALVAAINAGLGGTPFFAHENSVCTKTNISVDHINYLSSYGWCFNIEFQVQVGGPSAYPATVVSIVRNGGAPIVINQVANSLGEIAFILSQLGFQLFFVSGPNTIRVLVGYSGDTYTHLIIDSESAGQFDFAPSACNQADDIYAQTIEIPVLNAPFPDVKVDCMIASTDVLNCCN